jgi:hypothetical protein
MSYLDIAHGF